MFTEKIKQADSGIAAMCTILKDIYTRFYFVLGRIRYASVNYKPTIFLVLLSAFMHRS